MNFSDVILRWIDLYACNGHLFQSNVHESAYFLRLSMTLSSNKVSIFLGVRKEFFKEESGRSYHNISDLDVFLSFFIRVDFFLSYQVFLVNGR